MTTILVYTPSMMPLIAVPATETTSESINHLFGKGVIESITLPRGWLIADQSSAIEPDCELDVCSPTTDPWIQMGVYYRGEPISKEASDALEQLLRSKSGVHGAEVLLPKEIRSLQKVMGATTVGNNQFTNSIAAGSRSSPNFHLRGAHTKKLNRKTVLVVHGDFINPLDPMRKPVNSFEGTFFCGGIDRQSGGGKIQEVFMQGPAARMYRYRKLLIETLDSIEWMPG